MRTFEAQQRACPSAAEWRRFLDNYLAATEYQDFATHIDECPQCMALLDAMTSKPDSHDFLAMQAAEPDSSERVWVEQLIANLRRNSTCSQHADTASKSILEVGCTAAEAVTAGTDLGRFRVIRLLGRGGMGQVYEAEHKALKRRVALKMLPQDRQYSAKAIARFKCEAERLARLDHPNIVRVFDADECNGNPFFSMELIAGQTLNIRQHAGAMTYQEIARLVAAIAEAVQYAHDRDVLHLDLKPGNILMEKGTPKLLDFGLGRSLDMVDTGPTPFEKAGTPEYMAPEQWDPRGGAIEARTDVFGIGAILYELLVGRPPGERLDKEPAGTKGRWRPPAAPRSINRQIPRDLESICLRCLAEQPARRYPSAGEVARALRRFEHGLPVESGIRPRHVIRWCRSYPWRAALAVLAPCLALAGWCIVADLRAERLLARTDREFHAGLERCEQGYIAAGVDQIQSALTQLPTAARTRREQYTRSLRAWDEWRVRPLANRVFPNTITSAAVTPSAQYAIVATTDQVFFWNLVDQTCRTLPQADALSHPVDVALAADAGTAAAVGTNSRLLFWNTNGQLARNVLLGDWLGTRVAMLNNQGHCAIAFDRPQQPIGVWSTAGRELFTNTPPAPLLGRYIHKIVPSPDGTLALAVTANGDGWLWDARTGTSIADLAARTNQRIHAGAFAQDGKTLAVAGARLVQLDYRPGALQVSRESAPLSSSSRIEDLAFRRDFGLNMITAHNGHSVLRRYDANLVAYEEYPLTDLGPRCWLVPQAGDTLVSGIGGNTLKLHAAPSFTMSSRQISRIPVEPRLGVLASGKWLVTLCRPTILKDQNVTVLPHRSSFQIWNADTLEPVAPEQPLPADCVGRCLATAATNYVFAIGCSRTEALTPTLYLAAGSPAGIVTLGALADCTDNIRALAFGADDRLLFAGTWREDRDSSDLVCWDRKTRQLLGKRVLPGVINALSCSARGQVAAGGNDGQLRIFPNADLTSSPLVFAGDQRIERLAFEPSGERLWLATSNGVVLGLRVAANALEVEHRWELPGLVEPRLACDELSDLILITGGKTSGITRWHAPTGQRLPFGFPRVTGIKDLACANGKVYATTLDGYLLARSIQYSEPMSGGTELSP